MNNWKSRHFSIPFFKVNNLLSKSIVDVTCDNSNLLKIFAHILSAEKIWLIRLRGEDLCKELISVNKMSFIEKYWKF